MFEKETEADPSAFEDESEAVLLRKGRRSFISEKEKEDGEDVPPPPPRHDVHLMGMSGPFCFEKETGRPSAFEDGGGALLLRKGKGSFISGKEMKGRRGRSSSSSS